MIIWLNGFQEAGAFAVAQQLQQLVPGSTLYDPGPVDAGLRELLPKERLEQVEGAAGGVRELPAWRRLFVETAVVLQAEVPGPLIAPVPLLRQDHRDEVFGALASRGVPVRHFLLRGEETILRDHGDGSADEEAHGGRGTPSRDGAYRWLARDAYPVDTRGRTPEATARALADALRGNAGDCTIVQTPEPHGETVAAGVLLFDGTERVLLVDPTYKPGWEFPGGIVERGEAPARAGVREVAEELGVELESVPRLLVVDWVRAVPPRVGGLRLLFDGGRLEATEAAELRLPGEELRDWRFVTEEEAAGLLPAEHRERLRWALRARSLRRPLYLEEGVPVGEVPQTVPSPNDLA